MATIKSLLKNQNFYNSINRPELAGIQNILDVTAPTRELLESVNQKLEIARSLQPFLDSTTQLTDSFYNLQQSLLPMILPSLPTELSQETYDTLMAHLTRVTDACDPVLKQLKRRKKHYEKKLNSLEFESQTPKKQSVVLKNKNITDLILSIVENTKSSFEMDKKTLVAHKKNNEIQSNILALQKESGVSDKKRTFRENIMLILISITLIISAIPVVKSCSNGNATVPAKKSNCEKPPSVLTPP